MKGGKFLISMDFEDLYIHPRGVLPLNLQMPNIKKYDGTTCPRMYLRMYCNAMFYWGHDERSRCLGRAYRRMQGNGWQTKKKAILACRRS